MEKRMGEETKRLWTPERRLQTSWSPILNYPDVLGHRQRHVFPPLSIRVAFSFFFFLFLLIIYNLFNSFFLKCDDFELYPIHNKYKHRHFSDVSPTLGGLHCYSCLCRLLVDTLTHDFC